MEATHPLAIESFSYSWLLNARRPSLDGLSDSESDSESTHQDQYITFAVLHSMRFSEADEAKNFKFDINDSECGLVHADEIFSDGHIMPLYLDRPKPPVEEESLKQAFNNSSSAPATPANFSLSVRGKKEPQDYIIQKWKKLLGTRILRKWFGFLRPVCKRLGGSRKSCAKVDDLTRKAREVQSWSNYCKADPRKTKSCSNTPQESPLHYTTTAYNSPDVWRDMAAQTSITEAIIHCRKSFGMLDTT
nr:probable membrane-associated kinase regulator 6 [Ipomoea batatas]